MPPRQKIRPLFTRPIKKQRLAIITSFLIGSAVSWRETVAILMEKPKTRDSCLVCLCGPTGFTSLRTHLGTSLPPQARRPGAGPILWETSDKRLTGLFVAENWWNIFWWNVFWWKIIKISSGEIDIRQIPSWWNANIWTELCHFNFFWCGALLCPF